MPNKNNQINLKDEMTEFLLYTSPNGEIKVEVFLHNENIWLSQNRMAELFGVDRSVITKHLINIFNEGELEENRACAKFAPRREEEPLKFYNLDAIIAVGYRVNSKKATQ